MIEGLRVLVADDERPAREKLRRFLEDSPSVSVIYEARNGARAVDVVRRERPDAVFLDIRMPGIDGIAAAESMLGVGAPHVVFVTAFDEHAIRAFELGAADYLLKPFDRQRFDAALERVQRAVSTEQTASDVNRLRGTLRALTDTTHVHDRLLVEDEGRTRIVPLDEIVRIDAAGNYMMVVTQDGPFRMRATMTQLEGRLPRDQFARVNRSQIINIRFVHDMAPVGHGDLEVRLTDRSTVRLSRRYRDRIDNW